MTALTSGDAQVVLSITADFAADVIYARYREIGGAWSAENETFKRTGSGNLTITGLANLTRYQFGVYARDDVMGPWDFGLATPDDGGPEPTDPTDQASLPLHYLRLTLAGSVTFQDWVGAANADEALEWIYAVQTTVFTKPFAIVDWAENWQRNRNAGGARNYFITQGDLILQFRADVDPDHTEIQAAYAFMNKMGAITNEMEALSGRAGYLNIKTFALMSGPSRPYNIEKNTYSDFYQTLYRIAYDQ